MDATPTRNASTNPIPPSSHALAVAEDWLASNGIDEAIPGNPTIEVDNTSQQITYRAYKFNNGQRGHDTSKILSGHHRLLEEDRVVPLAVPLTSAVRDAFQELQDGDEAHQVTLVEVTAGMAWATTDVRYTDPANREIAERHTSG